MKGFIVLCLATISLSAHAAPPPKAVVEEIFKKASNAAVKTDADVQSEINKSVDFARMGRLVLGKEISKIPSAEVSWFTATLKEIITRTVYPNAPEFLTGVKIEYGSVSVKGKRAVVKSTVENKSDFTDVDYTLEMQADGSWRVVDVSLDGESWVDSIRDQVLETLKKDKWAGLKRKLSDRLAELNKEKQSTANSMSEVGGRS